MEWCGRPHGREEATRPHVLPADVAPPPIRLAHQARSLPRSLPFLRLSESLRLLFLPSRTPQLTQT